mmetsp:Transcript_19953/g.70951  ORF Transcript_19953/g.70951 Transcript_19953/m.70951 type:complete len:375 (-) Transcript_19953:1453-2577(-)
MRRRGDARGRGSKTSPYHPPSRPHGARLFGGTLFNITGGGPRGGAGMGRCQPQRGKGAFAAGLEVGLFRGKGAFSDVPAVFLGRVALERLWGVVKFQRGLEREPDGVVSEGELAPQRDDVKAQLRINLRRIRIVPRRRNRLPTLPKRLRELCGVGAHVLDESDDGVGHRILQLACPLAMIIFRRSPQRGERRQRPKGVRNVSRRRKGEGRAREVEPRRHAFHTLQSPQTLRVQLRLDARPALLLQRRSGREDRLEGGEDVGADVQGLVHLRRYQPNERRLQPTLQQSHVARQERQRRRRVGPRARIRRVGVVLVVCALQGSFDFFQSLNPYNFKRQRQKRMQQRLQHDARGPARLDAAQGLLESGVVHSRSERL